MHFSFFTMSRPINMKVKHLYNKCPELCEQVASAVKHLQNPAEKIVPGSPEAALYLECQPHSA